MDATPSIEHIQHFLYIPELDESYAFKKSQGPNISLRPAVKGSFGINITSIRIAMPKETPATLRWICHTKTMAPDCGDCCSVLFGLGIHL
jgi:hypothetical protein